MFNSKYPIISAPMNQVSDLDFALAVAEAGAFPSISGYCYHTVDEIIESFEKFVKITGTGNIIAALDDSVIVNQKIIDMLTRLNISHVIRYKNEEYSSIRQDNLEKISTFLLSKIPCKKINIHNIENNTNQIHFIKGNDGAGRPGSQSTKELFDSIKSKFPTLSLVPIGGIGTPEQVKYYIDQGATAVAVGTVLAASLESCLSYGTKEKMISANSTDLIKLDNVNKQKALIFSNDIKNDDSNHTKSLKVGISSQGQQGHVFAGNGIDFITEIKSVKEIIKNLAMYL